jgi:hypothetical protein
MTMNSVPSAAVPESWREHQVGVRELAVGARLVLEALFELRVAVEALVQHLDRDAVPEGVVGTEVHGAHAADTDATLNRVAAGDDQPDEGIHRGAVRRARKPAATAEAI